MHCVRQVFKVIPGEVLHQVRTNTNMDEVLASHASKLQDGGRWLTGEWVVNIGIDT